MKKVLFSEKQQFRQWWNILLILVATVPAMVFSGYALYQQTVNGIQVGDEPAPNAVLAIFIVVMMALLWSYLAMKLEVWIDQEGIHYRFWPLIFKERLISIYEIQRYEIRQYRPIVDYGGWGMKKSFKWGRAYNISGNIGLQLYLNNNKKVLFGTQRQQAILHAMDTVMAEKQRK
ncbi:MAG: hypothetical protein JNK09_09765 [Prolixibacteraceae bacterium]|nr:hypothetical protein [Prolixibacteraceae bacterium]